MRDEAPIVVIHYGPSSYLRHTLRAARRSNPGKRVFFLGDDTNRRFCPRGVDFLGRQKFAHGAKLEKFRKIFQPIEGARHKFNKRGGTKQWLAFVFERWFIIEQWLRELGVKRFWTFDSDTMVAANLLCREPRFGEFQATEQCRGCCLNGLINDTAVVADYTEWMIAIFENQAFLDQQRERLRIHDGLCFNEMDAWRHYRDNNRVTTTALGDVCEGEMFDDALAITKGYEVSALKVNGRIPVKKTFLDTRGGAFAFPLGAPPARLVTLNLSWLPDFIYSRIGRICRPLGKLDYEPALCAELDLRAPLLVRWRSRFACI